MERERIMLEVYVDLDPTPGTFHSKESARNQIAAILQNMLPHYKPMVSTTNYQDVYAGSDDPEDDPYAYPDCTCIARMNDPEAGHEGTCDISTRRYKYPARARVARIRAQALADKLHREGKL
jgi:hypothetical protein